jgi:SAM-dependent methyltransferase
MAPESTTPRCLLCGELSPPRHAFASHELRYCSRCRLGQLAPLPTDTELAALYGTRDYYECSDLVGYAGYVEAAPQLRRTFAAKLAWLRRSGPIASLAEIGCGPGYLLEVARDLGIRDLAGVDRNPWAVEQARAQGLDVRRGSVEVLPAAGRYDAIVMLDLLEHVPAPIPFLRAVRAHLHPHGRLLIMVPNIRSLLARVSGPRWVSVKIPEHVLYYTRRSMRLTLDRAGLETTAMRAATQHVSLAFLLDRLGRLAPRASACARAPIRLLGLEHRVLPVTNGSLDVLARARAA